MIKRLPLLWTGLDGWLPYWSAYTYDLRFVARDWKTRPHGPMRYAPSGLEKIHLKTDAHV